MSRTLSEMERPTLDVGERPTLEFPPTFDVRALEQQLYRIEMAVRRLEKLEFQSRDMVDAFEAASAIVMAVDRIRKMLQS